MNNEQEAIIIGAIRGCETLETIESTFDLFDVLDKRKRIDILVKAMYNPEMFYSSGNPDLELEYDLTIEMFLAMTWKPTETHNTVGLY